MKSSDVRLRRTRIAGERGAAGDGAQGGRCPTRPDARAHRDALDPDALHPQRNRIAEGEQEQIEPGLSLERRAVEGRELQVAHDRAQLGLPEQQPSDQRQREHAGHLQHRERPSCLAPRTSRRRAQDVVRPREHQQDAMIETPQHVVPAGAVPQARQQERDHHVARPGPFAGARTAERDVDVIAEPRRQGDVPAAPEVGGVARQVRVIEVLGQLETEPA